MDFFVDKDSIVRKIWGKGDTVLFIFAGASAEFALNKAVDWLYFTGRLPADPLARLFSTVNYARQIVFSEKHAAKQAIDKIAGIHASVEKGRNAKIPAWAYRDVLFMLIGYSISSFELLERKITPAEKEEVFRVFRRVGEGLGLDELPPDYNEWLPLRQQHLQDDLLKSSYTEDLYKQYRKHLGALRYTLLIEAQKLVCPDKVRELLAIRKYSLFKPLLIVYKIIRKLRLDWLLKSAILPSKYKAEIKGLDTV